MNNMSLAVGRMLLILAISGIACGAETLWSAEDQWVKIERQDDPAATPNDHPVALDTASVASALGALRLAEPSTGAIFTHEELNHLAPHVVAGLAKAGPRQDLTFSTLGSDTLNVNTGRIFYDEGKLNVIFGEVHASYRKKNVYGQRDQDFVPRRQGARGEASQEKWALAALPGVALHRKDWVTIDPEIVASEAEAAPAVPPPQESLTLERRLQTLKDLKDKGLISPEAYDAKLQQLLSEL